MAFLLKQTCLGQHGTHSDTPFISFVVPKIPMRIEGVKALGFKELDTATNNFSSTTEIGQGGYGKVYKGALKEGTIVAIKRAQQGSLQGEKEFYTEIELLSRVHHRNLVSLVGYCNEGSEQVSLQTRKIVHTHRAESVFYSCILRGEGSMLGGIISLIVSVHPLVEF